MLQRRSSTICAAALLSASIMAAAGRVEAREAPSQPTQEASSFVRSLGTKAIAALGPSTPSNQRVATFRRLLSEDFDLPGAAQFALGPYARRLTQPQRQEFIALFRDALAEAYAKRLGDYAGQAFRVTGVRPAGDGTIIVGSEVKRARGTPIRIDWQISRQHGHFLVTDVAVDGVSEKLTERHTFVGIIERNGGQPAAVIAALRQQLQGSPVAQRGSSNPGARR
jgi:phospholipid transport system substrate-binding protein